MKDVLIAIPARIGSKRLPGKPLQKICGLPLIIHVLRGCEGIEDAEIVVLTDSEEVKRVVEEYSFRAEIVDGEFSSGTERVACFVKKNSNFSIIFNVQGDEPLIKKHIIEEGIKEFRSHPHLHYLTYATRAINFNEDYENPNIVKVVVDKEGNALYFSRSPIPFTKEKMNNLILKHIGIYGFRRDSLLRFAQMERGELERVENLEQLRILENGRKIRVKIINDVMISVDVPEDVIKVEKFLKKREIEEF